MHKLVEIRACQLRPGTADAFLRDFVEVVVPTLRSWGTEVVAHGPSAHVPDACFLIRAYAGIDDRQARQEAFYGSDAWRHGPREEVVAASRSLSKRCPGWMPTIAGLRGGKQPPA